MQSRMKFLLYQSNAHTVVEVHFKNHPLSHSLSLSLSLSSLTLFLSPFKAAATVEKMTTKKQVEYFPALTR